MEVVVVYCDNHSKHTYMYKYIHVVDKVIVSSVRPYGMYMY